MSDREEKDVKEVPEGMVRRRRRVRKKRREKKSHEESKADADTLFAKAKGLLVGMEEDEEELGHVDLAEQIRRLKKRKEDDRPLDEVWGTKSRSSSWLWIVLVGMMISVVALIVGVTKWLSDESVVHVEGSEILGEIATIEKVDLAEGPLGWFHENSVEVIADVKGAIARVNEAENPEVLVDLVRSSSERSSVGLDLSLWGHDCLTNATSRFTWQPKVVHAVGGAGDAARGVLKLTGTRVDGNAYEIYFVQENGKVVLDWDASIGWSEMAVSEAMVRKPSQEIFLRCRVSKKASFDQNFGDVSYSGYVISGDFSDEFFLAYVPLSSKQGKMIDRELRLLLNYGSFVTDHPPYENQKVALRARFNPEIGNEGVFEIVEFLHEGWVSP